MINLTKFVLKHGRRSFYSIACLREGLRATLEAMPPKVSVDFEVFGKVQGVFFRKFTQEQATSLGLKGWCMNTADGTVKGSMEGESANITEMKKWLSTTGSPQSRIDKATFSNEKEIQNYTYSSFTIKR